MNYATLVEYYEKIENTSKRLEKVQFISELLKKIKIEEAQKIIFLLQGRVFPKWDDKKIGVAAKIILKALNLSTGISVSEIEKEWKTTGDLGIAAENIVGRKKQITLFSQDLTVLKVFNNLKKLASLGGSGSTDQKIQYISELLTSAQKSEAKYIVRTVLEELRVGAAGGTLRDSIACAFFPEQYNNRDTNKDEYQLVSQAIQDGYDLTNDYSKVVKIIMEKGYDGLKAIDMQIGTPINPMLFIKAQNIEDGFSTVGTPCAIEEKIDGFRVQVHKDGDKIELFTRRLENVSNQFPDVIETLRSHILVEKCILDSEVVGIDLITKQALPFQKISQRIRRKYDIEKTAKEVPVKIIIFDILMNNGINVLKSEYKNRREMLQEVTNENEDKIQLIKQIVTDDLETAENFYQQSLNQGHEGIMMKNLESIYKAGSRVGFGVKVKPVLESLDLAITDAEWGQGKRKGWLSSFGVSCKDPLTNNFVDLGKVGTGIKESGEDGSVTFDELTKLLQPLVIKESGTNVIVEPKIIIEIEYEEIQQSNNYNSGFALRFPRIKRIRYDRGIEDIATIETIERIYSEQRGRNN